MAGVSILYVPKPRNSEYHSRGHYYADCPALRRGGARPAEHLAPDTLRLLLRDLCKRCQRRALRDDSPPPEPARQGADQ